MEKNELKEVGFAMIDTIDFKTLSSKSIFFGHMSVGKNILNGVSRAVDKNNLNFNIIDFAKSDNNHFKQGCLLHAQIGRNGDPISKVLDFEQKMDEGWIKDFDIALFKFCYIDFKSETNIDAVFKEYSSKFDAMSKKYPHIIFAHTTVPLRQIQVGLKAFVKKIIGKSIGVEDNIARNRFNRLLNEKYKNRAPIFDIALFESTYPNGKREFIIMNEEICYTLIPEYTYDGGHLNVKGEDYLGEQFLIFLSQIVK